MPKPIRKQIADILRHVDDPELGINIVDLGLIYGLQFDEGDLTIQLTMTTPACPLSDYIKRNIHKVTGQVKGLQRVQIEIVWDPPWSPQMMEPEVRSRGFRQPPQYASQYT
ncbi:aromatic ring hydroxylase [Salinibacter sp. 10B]|uniref:metal-sulfur cluster assembly factor n=1 Tax=Salinibacter sp. 10B TaxID=1923971 RepID=UPI000CF550E4|nr:metal-sulfur cluster assembly factor [Salinibacter sp. 10B]PQJ35901.1 aromatic ring hydroxylase [Salinibacter sp. 10B]